jgi:5-methylcytosine-specific restriction endonuclease McrA
MGAQNYYQMATDVSLDFGKIGYQVNKTAKRLGQKLRKIPKASTKDAVVERYGASEQMRWLENLPVAPLSYVKTKAPMCKKRSVQKYTPEGRKEIHENLGIDTGLLKALSHQQLYGRSAEYADNRLSLYCAQYGKCAVTGRKFESLDGIHCHHKLPKGKGGNDNYQNLSLVCADIHILIHATTQPTIEKHCAILNLDKKQLTTLNKLRVEAGNPPIAV